MLLLNLQTVAYKGGEGLVAFYLPLPLPTKEGNEEGGDHPFPPLCKGRAGWGRVFVPVQEVREWSTPVLSAVEGNE